MSSSVMSWSQTAASNATADSTVNWAEGQAPSSVNDSGRAMMASVAKWRDDITGILVTSGSGTAYSITSNQVQASNLDGFTVQFTPGTTNTGAVTLAVDGQTARSLRFLTGVDLPVGVLISGSLYQATYRSATTEWLLHSFDASVYAVPIGGCIDYFGATAPNSSFVLPYGQAISRTTYSALFTLFSTTYGVGDGSTTFNVPDLRGRVVAGKDDMGGSAASRLTSTYFGTSAATLGAVGGSESHTLTTAQLATHSHGVTDIGHTHTASVYVGQASGGATSGGTAVPISPALLSLGSTVTGISINNAGSGSAHNNVQPTLIGNKLLRII